MGNLLHVLLSELGPGIKILVLSLGVTHELLLHEQTWAVELIAHYALALTPHENVSDFV
jgi:hypothetical protein